MKKCNFSMFIVAFVMVIEDCKKDEDSLPQITPKPSYDTYLAFAGHFELIDPWSYSMFNVSIIWQSLPATTFTGTVEK